ncbi:MAG: CobD/CbiB family protein, partial [Thermoplasmataceae archaeon]
EVALSLITGSVITETDPALLNSRIIEIIAKEYMEGIAGPLLYFIFFGIIGSIIYAVVSSSRGSYKKDNYRDIQLGKFSEYAFGAINWAVSGVSASMILVSTFLLTLNVGKSSPLGISRMSSDKATGISVGSMSSSLNLRIEHFGEYVLNDSGFDPQLKDIRNAMKIYYLSIFIYLSLIVIPLSFIMMLLYHIFGLPAILV